MCPCFHVSDHLYCVKPSKRIESINSLFSFIRVIQFDKSTSTQFHSSAKRLTQNSNFKVNQMNQNLKVIFLTKSFLSANANFMVCRRLPSDSQADHSADEINGPLIMERTVSFLEEINLKRKTRDCSRSSRRQNRIDENQY